MSSSVIKAREGMMEKNLIRSLGLKTHQHHMITLSENGKLTHRSKLFSTINPVGKSKAAKDFEVNKKTIDLVSQFLISEFGPEGAKIGVRLASLDLRIIKREGKYLTLKELISLNDKCYDFIKYDKKSLKNTEKLYKFFTEQENFSEKQLLGKDLDIVFASKVPKKFKLSELKKTLKGIDLDPKPSEEEVQELALIVRKKLKLLHKKAVTEEDIKDACLRAIFPHYKILAPEYFDKYNCTLRSETEYTLFDLLNYNDKPVELDRLKIKHYNGREVDFNLEKIKKTFSKLPIADLNDNLVKLKQKEINRIALNLQMRLIRLNKTAVTTSEVRTHFIRSLKKYKKKILPPPDWPKEQHFTNHCFNDHFEKLSGRACYRFYQHSQRLRFSTHDWEPFISRGCPTPNVVIREGKSHRAL